MAVLLNQWAQPDASGDNAFTFAGTMDLVGEAGTVTKDQIIETVMQGGGARPSRATAGTGGFIDMLPTDKNGIIYCTNSGSVTFRPLLSTGGDVEVGTQVTVVQFTVNPVVLGVNSGDAIDGVSDGTTSLTSQFATATYELQANGFWYVSVGLYGSVYNTSSLVCSGPWSANQNATVNIRRVGSIVTMTWAGPVAPISGTTNTTPITFTTAIPVQFRPAYTITGVTEVTKGTSGGTGLGVALIASNGIAVFNSEQNQTSSWDGTSGTTPVGLQGGSLSWTV
jgi:hypothetical protein